ncbi:OmpA family protein [Legionella tunisiensis]|uniref:OmpA family protein n=1 Tax=Legionella tunisiensis TaxID=1034944 RepID=UPI002FBE33F1
MIPAENLIIMQCQKDGLKTVANYLLSLGVQQSRLSVTWYGVQNPVASNDTEEGKAANRRVVIKIYK